MNATQARTIPNTIPYPSNVVYIGPYINTLQANIPLEHLTVDIKGQTRKILNLAATEENTRAWGGLPRPNSKDPAEHKGLMVTMKDGQRQEICATCAWFPFVHENGDLEVTVGKRDYHFARNHCCKIQHRMYAAIHYLQDTITWYPSYCPHCGDGIGRSDGLNAHLKKHHGLSNAEIEALKQQVAQVDDQAADAMVVDEVADVFSLDEVTDLEDSLVDDMDLEDSLEERLVASGFTIEGLPDFRSISHPSHNASGHLPSATLCYSSYPYCDIFCHLLPLHCDTLPTVSL
ncbi:hypothetical protein EIP91_000872 [Steccherinum ochraceum]|uniref:C2H2-type domain-containing protein n=1 Tax=Steccherinum ochraceum TaxID=92696 RepID=A0A4R0RW05_9APHY|nr:hypothetical protein EIP91_000872 [Steccherinum ochraceum]